MENTRPTKIIFDTDIGNDCDDAGTLAMLHRLCDKGEAELLAVTHCYSNPYFAGCIDAINRYFGREVPVGINYATPRATWGCYAEPLCETFENTYPAEVYGTPDAAPDTTVLLRRILADAEDGSITLVVTGALTSMAGLITSPADDISPLTGKELVSRKLARTIVMGGRFFETWPMPVYPDGNPNGTPVTWEWNIHDSGRWAAKTVFDEWCGELVFASYELGSYIKTMVGYPAREGLQNPVALAYEIHNHGAGRCSWDQTAMLEAIRPGAYWHYHEFGRITVDDDLVTHWHREEGGKHTYLMPKTDYEEIRQIMDDLIDGK